MLKRKYGLLKNLRFFEPYLYIYLLSLNIDLFHIGILFSIREIIIYIFEIPSGIIADEYGKKKELMICFLFYIISFVFFFVGGNFFIILAGKTSSEEKATIVGPTISGN